MRVVKITFVNSEKRHREVLVLRDKLNDTKWAMPWLQSMLKQGWMIVP